MARYSTFLREQPRLVDFIEGYAGRPGCDRGRRTAARAVRGSGAPIRFPALADKTRAPTPLSPQYCNTLSRVKLCLPCPTITIEMAIGSTIYMVKAGWILQSV